MDICQAKSVAICNRLATVHGFDSNQVQASPFIDLITQLLTQLIPIILNCIPNATPEALVQRLANLNFLDVMFIRRHARAALDDPQAVRTMLEVIVNEVKLAAKSVTPTEAKTLITAVAV